MAEGKHIGRPRGSRNDLLNDKCVKNHDKIVANYEAGGSIIELAKEIGVARGTIYRYMFYTGIREPQHHLMRADNEKGIARKARGIY